jgi:hypothetical protein
MKCIIEVERACLTVEENTTADGSITAHSKQVDVPESSAVEKSRNKLKEEAASMEHTLNHLPKIHFAMHVSEAK